MGVITRNSIVTDGLVIYLDAKNPNSYRSGSTSWNNLLGSPSGALVNNPPFSNLAGGSFTFGTGSSYVSIPETNLTNWSVSAWFKYDYTVFNATLFNLPVSSGNKSGTTTWDRVVFQGLSSLSFDTTGSIYFGTFGMGVWDNTPRWFGLKVDPTGSLDTTFDINYNVGQAVNQHQTYVGNDGFLYTSGTNLNFFAKRNKETGALISQASSGATSVGAHFIIDESQRKVYHMGAYTTAFGLSRNYICKFDLDTYAVDTVFNTGGGLNTIPNNGQLFLTSGNYFYTVGTFTSYKGTPINHIVKLDQSGSLDPTFNPGTGFSNATDVYCKLDSQDRLVCVGRVFTSYSGSVCSGIVRINPDGTRDTTFNIGTGFAGSGFAIKYISIQPDDKVIVSGVFTSYSGSTCNGIVRINPDGTRDTTFDTGTGISPLNTNLTSYIKPNGDILLGYGDIANTLSYNGTSFRSFILLNSSGSVVSGFNTGSGFTDTTSRAQFYFRVRNTAGTLTTVSSFGAWPSLGQRAAPITYQNAFNDWLNITYTKDSSNIIRTYINGTLRNTDTFSTASYQNVDLQIDTLATSLNNVSSIQIYNKALSATEILQNYNATKTRYGLT